MKIIFMNEKFIPYRTATAKIVLGLAKEMKALGHSVFVITTVQDEREEGESEYEGLVVHKIYSNYPSRLINIFSLYNFFILGKVKKLIKEIDPDIVHAHNIHYRISYGALKIAKKLDKKVFLTAHDVMSINHGKLNNYFDKNDLSIQTDFNYKLSLWHHLKTTRKKYNPLRNIIIRHYLKYVDKIFAVSNALKDALNQNGIKNVEVVHNGIDVLEWSVNKEAVNEFKKKYNLRNKKIVLFAGRLSTLKGGKKIIEAMHQVTQEVPEAVLLIAGKKDEYAERMRELAEDVGVRAVLTGWLSGVDLRNAYGASDVVVFPSICFDTFGMVNIEAMAAGKPVVATCFGGSPEVVSDGFTGYIRNPYNVGSFAKAITELLNDIEKAKRFGEAGRMRVVELFTLERQVKAYLAWYKK